MNKKIFKTLLSILLILVFSSCEDIIDVDLRSAPSRVVIEGNVRLDSLATVRITKTKDFSSTNDYLPVEGAEVRLSDDAGNSELLSLKAEGKYVASNIRGIEGRTYNLSVTVEGIEYTAESRMAPAVAIDSLSFFDFPMLDYPMPMVHFKDPLGTENDYYRVLVYINGERPHTRYSLLSGDVMDGFVFHQQLSVTPDNYDDDDDDPLQQGDEVMVELQVIDKEAYTFWLTLSGSDNSLNNPTSNIQGGALGYFSAYSYSRDEIIAEW